MLKSKNRALMLAFPRTLCHNLTLLLFFMLLAPGLQAQKPQTWTASDMQLALQKLEVLGSVLYVAAHPDDENTRLISWLANDKKYRTAYLSLTRGDGGQNLIGPELRERLGVIRTQELLEARKVDGGLQFFTRANDFGFSKTPEETFEIWDRQAVLADMVWVIRKFRPDVIITRFSTEPGGTHGHHTASAILAEEAFKAAADPRRFTEQLSSLQVWQAKRLLWNTSSWFFREQQFDTTGLVKLNMGGFNPLLGKSYTELAAESRSKHRSQGFGAALTRESSVEYLKPIISPPADNELFSGITTSWARVEGGQKIAGLLAQANRQFNPLAPWELMPLFIELHKAMRQLPDHPYKDTKLQELETLMLASTGVFAELTTSARGAAAGSSVPVKLEVVNRSQVPLSLRSITTTGAAWDSTLSQPLAANEPFFLQRRLRIPAAASPTQPYWLVQAADKGMFRFEDVQLTGEAQNGAPLSVTLMLQLNGMALPLSLPLVYKTVDPAIGEVYQPFVVTPPIMLTPLQDQLIFSDAQGQELQVRVRAGKPLTEGELRLQLPAGWKAQPERIALDPLRQDEERTYSFTVSPPQKAGSGTIQLQAQVEGKRYSRGYETLQAPHFPTQTLFPEARVGVVRLDLKREAKHIGYIMGAGDAVPDYLQQVGYTVSLLDPARISAAQLARYDAVLLGIRAFNTQQALKHSKDVLEAYARGGGVVIIQYNTSHELVTADIAPFPLRLSRARITDEESPVKIVAPRHQALNYPNKITEKDFEGWVQERGLYFADSWSAEWQPLLSSQDAGEAPQQGGLLVAPVGRGYYVYGAYSWFRQLPAGVPGAYRILANLMALGKPMPK
jgi:LmbE family N-acetylglucosaminyl deacetylase